jgi:hypothetical protein
MLAPAHFQLSFRVQSRKRVSDEFAEVARADLDFQGGGNSIALVNGGVNEQQLRTVSRDIESLIDELEGLGVKSKGSANSAAAYQLVSSTAKALLRDFGFPPLH